jgi:hypothetical protein
MPRLSISERTRILTLYYEHICLKCKLNLHFKRARYHVLRKFALEEDIISSERTIRRTIKHWLLTGSVLNKKSLTRSIRLTKITAGDLSNLDLYLDTLRNILIH